MLGFADAEQYIVLCAPLCKTIDFVQLIIVYHEADDGGLVTLNCSWICFILETHMDTLLVFLYKKGS